VAESTDAGGQSGLRTFLIAGVGGYTRLIRESGEDEAASELATAFGETVRDTLGDFGGHLEVRGDEALCVFGSAREALRAGIALQRSLRTALTIGVGIGLDAGEAAATEDGYRGDAIERATRLCAAAGPGRVLATETVVRLAQRVPGVDYGAPKLMRLTGIEGRIRVHELSSTEPLPPIPVHDAAGTTRGRRGLGWLLPWRHGSE
jgi:class 3 adenylate cyclase